MARRADLIVEPAIAFRICCDYASDKKDLMDLVNV